MTGGAGSFRVAFVVAGTQKGGTTALDAYLRRHPHLCMAKLRDGTRLGPHKVLGLPKEPHFFDTEGFFAERTVDYSVYHGLFDPQPGRVCGECTPSYMWWQNAPRRMWEYNPALKVIVLLRNPVTRAYSHWNMARAYWETASFEDALRLEPERARRALPLQDRRFSYLDRGFYTEQLRRLWRFFPPEQVLVLKSERLETQAAATLERVWRFLDVPPPIALVPQRANTGTYEAPMSEAVCIRLRDYYRSEIRALEGMLDWDCSDWLEHPVNADADRSC